MATSSNRDTLLNLMKMEKEMFMADKAHLSATEKEQKWGARTVELTAALGSAIAIPPATSATHAPEFSHSNRRVATLPVTTAGMARSHSDLPATHNVGRRQENVQVPTILKKRSISSQNGPCPFTGSGGAIPFSSATTRRTDNEAIRQYQSNTEDPFSPLKTRRLSKPERMVDCAVHDDPSTFYKQKSTSPMTLSPTSVVPNHHRRPPPLQSVSPPQPLMLGPFSALSQSPATDGLTDFTPPTSVGLSRQSSSICDLSMMRINSQFSNAASDQNVSTNDNPAQMPFEDGNHQIGLLSNNDSNLYEQRQCTQGRPGHAQYPNPSLVPVPFNQPTAMKRSNSAETDQSTASDSSSRSLESSSSGTRKLAPKLPTTGLPVSRQSSSSGHEVIRQRSADGSVKEVVSILKAPYVRPHHDKIKCSQCNAKPDGFRGEHELRRHTERAHFVLRKAFVCVDISPDKKFLANCKACTSKKRYNAYYNAAAHLRRVHFNPKEKGGKGKTKPKESRGGKGGGDWPPMEVVKEWMTELEEKVAPNAPVYNDDNEPEDDNPSTLSYKFSDEQPIARDHQRLDDFSLETTSRLDIPNGNRALSTAPVLSLSAPTPRPPYDSLSLHLSQPSETQASLSPGFLDLSLDVSSNEPEEPFALWEMSPLDGFPEHISFY